MTQEKEKDKSTTHSSTSTTRHTPEYVKGEGTETQRQQAEAERLREGRPVEPRQMTVPTRPVRRKPLDPEVVGWPTYKMDEEAQEQAQKDWEKQNEEFMAKYPEMREQEEAKKKKDSPEVKKIREAINNLYGITNSPSREEIVAAIATGLGASVGQEESHPVTGPGTAGAGAPGLSIPGQPGVTNPSQPPQGGHTASEHPQK